MNFYSLLDKLIFLYPLSIYNNLRKVKILKFKMNLKKSVHVLLACLTALPLMLTPTHVSAASDANINLSSEKQLIKGFGGINHPAWIGDLTAAQRETAFGNGPNQLGFSILRIYVDENRNNWYREVATAKRAIEQGALVFASPWNPPSDMVETFNRNGDTNAKRLRYDKYAAYAQHLNDFVTYMKDNGVDLYAISVQNEPDYAHEWTWWTPQEILRFMKENAGSIQNTKVMAPESFQYLKNMSDPILNDPQALANMDILGAHTYGTQFKDFAYPLFKQKGAGKELWMTEVYYPNSDNNSSDRWPEALDVSYHMHNAMVEGDFQAYVWWYIRRQYGPMNEDGSISKRGYNMAHFSKFVRPGYYRVDATKNPDTNTFVSAYKGDNKVVIVAINRGTSAVNQKFVLQNGNASTVSSWVTDSSRNLASGAPITVSGGAFTAQLPAQSVTTFVANITGSSVTPGSGTTYEAETGTTLTDAVIETLYPGYTGTGYVNFNAYTGSAIQWNAITNTITGTKNVKFRYALESGTRNLDIFVNGTKVISNEPFPATGSWSTWSEKIIQVPMNAGTNTIKVVTTGTEGPNIDNINVTAVQ
ncbi:glucuronoarabinoxylan endo-1,4-beta-xylanase [Paenibacillus sp. PvP094]